MTLKQASELVTSEPIGKGPCEKCGSSDNKVTYSDGHSYCFTPGCGYQKPSEENYVSTTTQEDVPRVPGDFIFGEVEPLPIRGLTQDTCKRWNYQVGRDARGRKVQIANYYDDKGQLVGQKIRGKDKQFYTTGNPKEWPLYGKFKSQASGRRIIVCEGEIDALSISQVLQHRWPVVSLPGGAASARKSITRELQWLSSFEEVVLCFDNDVAGHTATSDVVGLFPPGKVSVVTLPLKDANAMLQEGREDELVKALWGAKPYRPDGVVSVADVLDDALRDPEEGLPWFIEELNRTTYGRRYGECVALGAGTGVGKTTFITQQIAEDLKTHAVGVFALEQLPTETALRVAGMLDSTPYHIPGTDRTGLRETLESITDLYMYDSFGSTEWDVIKERIRYLVHAHDVRIFYLDHLTALAAHADDERKALESIMADIGGLVKELNIWLLFVSHLTTPDGKPHEEGGRVMARHFKGSRSIAFWSHFMFGIERAQQADSEDERSMSTLRVLKDRYTGKATGQTIDLTYSHETGKFETIDNVFQEEF